MRKIPPERSQGIEFIRLSSLPINQMVKFKEWLGAADMLSIKSNHETIHNCVPYGVYEFWHQHFQSEKMLFTSSLF